MKIGVFSNPNKDVGNKVRDKVFSAARELGITAEPFAEADKYDFIVSVGGDGTILRVVKNCVQSDTPILGVNMGTVGFLTEVEPSDIQAALDRLKDKEFRLERRALIDARVGGEQFFALNDVVMRSVGGRMIAMEVRVGDALIDKFKCDGYIACTPTGSTAYSLSAGGSVIGPNTPVIALTPVNPHTLRTRPIVVGSFEQITMTNVGAERAAVFVDGERAAELSGGGVVSVTGWDRSAMFVRFDRKSFYSRLLNKLNRWSAAED